MIASHFLNILNNFGIDFFSGVPDSLLNPICDELYNRYGRDSDRHLIAHNEGGAVGYAAGYHLATGKVPCVYLQNSGIGNIVNPVCSLTSPYVYGIPVLYIIGWRGQPGIVDEPQHKFQGMITAEQIKGLDVALYSFTKTTSEDDIVSILKDFEKLFAVGKSAVILVGKDAYSSSGSHEYKNSWTIIREKAIERIVEIAKEDIVVASTGKISRELFEVRERAGDMHDRDFLTVGSMGHDAMIAFGIASQKQGKKIWCIQGDGAFIMHMGQAALIGSTSPDNLVHIVINNAAHESVGGMPTVGSDIDLCGIAKACGYKRVFSVNTIKELDEILRTISLADKCSFLEIKCAMDSRKDLARPTTTPKENKEALMRLLTCKKYSKP